MNSNSKKSFARPPGIEIVGRVLSLNADDVQVGFRKILPNLESPETFQTSAWHKAVGSFVPERSRSTTSVIHTSITSITLIKQDFDSQSPTQWRLPMRSSNQKFLVSWTDHAFSNNLTHIAKTATTGILSGMWLMANGIIYYDYYAVGDSPCQPRRLCQSRASAKQAQGTSLFVGHTNTVARGDTFQYWTTRSKFQQLNKRQ